MTTKEQFIIEHNKLSPSSLRVTRDMLTRFKTEKPTLFKSDDWSIEKIRRPFICWLTSLPKAKEDD